MVFEPGLVPGSSEEITVATIRVEAQREVSAPPWAVFDVLRDYHNRPRILPSNYSGFTVQEGGQGSGTVATYRLKVGPRERGYRIRVAEEPAQLRLIERDTQSSMATTWSVASGGNGGSRVSILTEWRGAGGVGGFFEARFAPAGLRRVYADMLERLAGAVQGSPTRT